MGFYGGSDGGHSDSPLVGVVRRFPVPAYRRGNITEFDG